MPNARPGSTVSVAPAPVASPQVQAVPRPQPQLAPRPAPVMAGRQPAPQREARVAESAPRVVSPPPTPQVDRQPIATGRADGGGGQRGGNHGGGRGGEGRGSRGDRADN
jgi:hypothetical protein